MNQSKLEQKTTQEEKGKGILKKTAKVLGYTVGGPLLFMYGGPTFVRKVYEKLFFEEVGLRSLDKMYRIGSIALGTMGGLMATPTFSSYFLYKIANTITPLTQEEAFIPCVAAAGIANGASLAYEGIKWVRHYREEKKSLYLKS